MSHFKAFYQLNESLSNNTDPKYLHYLLNFADDQDMVEFLADEIAAEKSNQKSLELPGSGFAVKTEAAEVTFSKSTGNEKLV